MVCQEQKPKSTPPSQPLSSAEERIWFLEQLYPGLPTFNIPILIHLNGVLDEEVLRQSFEELSNRHDGLRTRFSIGPDEKPIRIIDSISKMPNNSVDLSGLDEKKQKAELTRLTMLESAKLFNLTSGPLCRVVTYKLRTTSYAILIVMHHTISDGRSVNILLDDFAFVYDSIRTGKSPSQMRGGHSYAEYAFQQRRRNGSEVIERKVQFWCEQLAGVPSELDLPLDHPRPAVSTHRGAYHEFLLPTELVNGLSSLANQNDTTLFTALLASYQALLARYTGQTDIVVGVPVAGRSDDTRDIVGLFVNTVVLRADLSADPSFTQLLAQLRDRTREAYDNQDVPIDRVVDELVSSRNPNQRTLFQTLINYRSFDTAAISHCGFEVTAQRLPTPSALTDLDLTLEKSTGGILARFNYQVDLFEQSTVKSISKHFTELMTAALRQPEVSLSQLDFSDPAENDRILRWSEGEHLELEQSSVLNLISHQASLRPDQLAVLWRDSLLTYQELDQHSEALASILVERGVGAETIVGLYLDRSPELIIAMLAILKAGGAYLPLDPSYPHERLQFMVRDASLRYIVTEDSLADKFSDAVPFIINSKERHLADLRGVKETTHSANRRALAYIIYTSGSTGQPKGVMVEHGNLLNQISWINKQFEVGIRDRVLQQAAVSFDASVWEIFSALTTGATLVLPSDSERKDPFALSRLLASHRVTIMQCIPSFLDVLLRAGTFRNLSNLRLVCCGGEALSAKLVTDLAQQTNAKCINLYGPTEGTINALYNEVEPTTKRVSIGRPVANMRAYVLDPYLRPTPIGVPGELWIGGAGVTRGYLGRQELTAERFVPSPFIAGDRLYRTGDRARWREHGKIDFLGRLDDQVKLRGYRIELGEIEASLDRLSGVARSVAAVREDTPGDQRLVAYIVPEGEMDCEALRAALRRQLPEFMVPSVFVAVGEFPLTPSGKLDRKALPAPGSLARSASAPTTQIEKTLAAIWLDIFGIDHVGIDDDFFDLGGHSLLAARAVSRIEKSLGVKLPLKTLFLAPSIRRLAAEIDGSPTHEQPDNSVVPVNRGDPLPLSSEQERMWFLNQVDPSSSHYVVPELVGIRGELDLGALNTAVSQMVKRHEALRTRFVFSDGSPLQVIDRPHPVSMPLVDLSAIPNADHRGKELDRRIHEMVEAPFDLTNGLLVRTAVYRLSAREHVLVLCIHHIACDGWSMNLMLSDLGRFYDKGVNHTPGALSAPELQYADYAVWQRRTGSLVSDRKLSYWVEKLAGVPRLEIPIDKIRPSIPSHRGESFAFELPRDAVAKLREMTRSHGATLFSALLSVFQALLARRADQEDVVVGIPVAGRVRPELESIVGLFVNMLAIRLTVSDHQSFMALLDRTRDTLSDAYAHQEVQLDQIVRVLNPTRDRGRHPIFQITVNHVLLDPTPTRWTNLEISRLLLKPKTAKFDISLTFIEDHEGVSARLDYATDLFAPSTIKRMADDFLVLVDRVASEPEVSIRQIWPR